MGFLLHITYINHILDCIVYMQKIFREFLDVKMSALKASL